MVDIIVDANNCIETLRVLLSLRLAHLILALALPILALDLLILLLALLAVKLLRVLLVLLTVKLFLALLVRLLLLKKRKYTIVGKSTRIITSTY